MLHAVSSDHGGLARTLFPGPYTAKVDLPFLRLGSLSLLSIHSGCSLGIAQGLGTTQPFHLLPCSLTISPP